MTQINEMCCSSSDPGSANARTHAHNFQCTGFATVLTRTVTCTFMSTLELMQKQRLLSLSSDLRQYHCMVTTEVGLLKFVSFWTKQKSCSWQVVIFTDSLLHCNKSWLNCNFCGMTCCLNQPGRYNRCVHQKFFIFCSKL